MLEFKPLTPELKGLAESYFFQYGENSCQHSFVSSWCMQDKYEDQLCEKEGTLYIFRKGLSTEQERVYLFPMGREEGLKEAIEEICRDAHGHGARVCFRTLTGRAGNRLLSLFPGKFVLEPARDMAEYLYHRGKLADLPGREMAAKRYDINTFFRDYGERAAVERIEASHLEEIRNFQADWLKTRQENEEDVQLEYENRAIQRGLESFEELGLSGILIRIDGELKGYAYGAPLSESCYDVMIEKGDRRIPDIYRILNRDLVRLCCEGFTYINREEDLGVEGLRRAKLSYRPDILLEKYIAREVEGP